MRVISSITLWLFAGVFLGSPGYAADAQSGMAVLVNQNIELTPGSSLIVSIANLGTGRADVHARADCEKIEGVVQFIGTAAPLASEENGVKTLNLLDELPFRLAPGQVFPLQFFQASPTTETVIVTTVVPQRAEHCLAPATAAILNTAGALVSTAPNATGTRVPARPKPIILDEPAKRCCACAPVCACGYCD